MSRFITQHEDQTTQFMNTATAGQRGRILYGSGPVMSLEQLERVNTPAPKGRFHRPVPFSDFAGATVQALEDHGLNVVHSEYQVTGSKEDPASRFFGALEIQPAPLEGQLITADDWKLIVGMRGSHDQSIQRGLVLGSRVMVCSNLCFSGDLGAWKTKQTLNIDERLPAIIRDAVERIPGMAERENVLFDRMRDLQMSQRQGDAALVEMHRRGALPGPQLTRALAEWVEPTHQEHITESGHDWSGWRLFNAATESLKPTGQTFNPHTQEQRSRIISGFMSEVVGL
jgi:hypothetical protein